MDSGRRRKRAKRIGRRTAAIAAGIGFTVAGMGAGLGCNAALTSSDSASQGMGSVSRVSQSLADWASSAASSSSAGEESAALERDVSTYTSLFTESGGDVRSYLRGVGSLCETYSVSDWEREPAVQRGIAIGLVRSRLSERQLQQFIARIAEGDSQMRDRLRAAIVALR